MANKYRKIPQINELIKHFNNLDLPVEYIKITSQKVIDNFRSKIKENPQFDFEEEDIIKEIEFKLKNENIYSFKEVINATGVVLHTNLGRALLSKAAIDKLIQISTNYSNLEYDLEVGTRGTRYDHLIDIIRKLTGAEDAIIVNNNAAAVFLMLNSLSKDCETIVSRGELVEIGDSFRIYEFMENSGANVIEVGSTNRTHLVDYERKIGENTKILMKVHTSNYKISGFHKEVSAPELKTLTKDKEIYVLEDLGSGSLIDLTAFGLSHERTVKDCINEGIDLVSFSCDKLLGGPQGGIICGKSKLIKKIKDNQLLRTFRVGKLTLAALEATLIEYLDLEKALLNIPTLRMISISLDELEKKAQVLFNMIEREIENIEFEITDSTSLVGGGAFPNEKLNSKSVSISSNFSSKLEEYLRLSKYHIITSVYDDKVHLDLRTLKEGDFPKIVEVLKDFYGNKLWDI